MASMIKSITEIIRPKTTVGSAKMATQKYYVVWKGRKTGIFNSWKEASAQVNGYPQAQFKSFESKDAAVEAFRSGYAEQVARRSPQPPPQRLLKMPGLIADSYCVDASCSGSPGRLEYRGLHTSTGKLLFECGPFARGTNNIGEFLAIVEALALLKKKASSQPIYSDSATALLWLRNKKCNTRLLPDGQNKALFERIAQAEDWLKNNRYENKVLKWDTAAWGEIPADYGRK